MGLGENETKRSRVEEEEVGLRHREKRRRHSGEEIVMMREKRSRHEMRMKIEEKTSRSLEMGTVERWRSSKREKARDLEFSGSEDETMRPRVGLEKGGLERNVERSRIGENKDEKERFHNIFSVIFSPFHLSLFPFSTFCCCRHETVDERLERMQREENEKEVKLCYLVF